MPTTHLTNPETATLKRVAESSNIRDRCIYELLLTSGIRRNELTRLNISDLHLDSQVAKVKGKGDKGRVVSYSLETSYLLRRLIANRPEEDPLFINKNNERISDKHIWRVCNKLGKKSDIRQHVHPHKVRHYYATNAISQGMNILKLRDLLGHNKAVTTMIYVDISNDDLKIAYDEGMRRHG